MLLNNLFAKYSTIEKSCYRIPISVENLFVGCDANNNCRLFISDHFEKGDKKGVFHIFRKFADNYEAKGKHLHTVSLYLLGLSLLGYHIHSHVLWEINKNASWLSFACHGALLLVLHFNLAIFPSQ